MAVTASDRMTWSVTLSCYLLVVTAYVCCGSEDAVFGPILSISQGRLQGNIRYAADSLLPVYAFLGVPYAAPPVGPLRFSAPQPPQPWEGIRNATQYGARCMQPLTGLTSLQDRQGGSYSEDCLFLNIYTPSMTGSRPVLVYIHGGAFIEGSAELMDGTAYAALQDLVVVSINYRLGIFGFLSTEDESAPGNYGLLDQQMALQWVQKNIAVFGGNADLVTLYGFSAGAYSASVHLLAPSSAGLFQRVIIESGKILAHSAIPAPGTLRKSTLALAKKLGCDTSGSDSLIQCLKEKEAEAIMAADDVTFQYGVLKWGPTIDGDLVSDSPQNLYRTGQYNKVDFLGSIASHEGYLFSQSIFEDIDADFTYKHCRDNIRGALRHTGGFAEVIDSVTDRLTAAYCGQESEQSSSSVYQERFTEFAGDLVFAMPTYRQALYHTASGGNVFFYEFAHAISGPGRPEWVKANHGDIRTFSTGETLSAPDVSRTRAFSEEDVKITLILMTYIANFVKTGNPNPDGKVEFPQFDSDQQQYLVVTDVPTMSARWHPQRLQLWTELSELSPKSSSRGERVEL